MLQRSPPMTPMKTERVTILAAPAFKAFLVAEAEREGVSVGELVRRRCEPRPAARDAADDDAATLRALAAELSRAVQEARQSLREGLAEAEAALGALHAAGPAGSALRAAEPPAPWPVPAAGSDAAPMPRKARRTPKPRP
jgi:GAF domain-containing protein